MGVSQAPGNRQVPSGLSRDLTLELGNDAFSFKKGSVSQRLGSAPRPHPPHTYTGSSESFPMILAQQKVVSGPSLTAVLVRAGSLSPSSTPFIYILPPLINSQSASLCKLQLDKLPDNNCQNQELFGKSLSFVSISWETTLPLVAKLATPSHTQDYRSSYTTAGHAGPWHNTASMMWILGLLTYDEI